MRFIFLIIFCCISSLFSIQAQNSIDQPCARILTGAGMDSIHWTATNCPNFTGYVIFASANLGAPLMPVDTITNPAQLGYSYSNVGQTARNYQIGMLCGGVLTTSSNVVSNQRPVTPNIRSVSTQAGYPVLMWDASPSPEVIGYQVYKEQPYGSGNFFPYPSNNTIVNALFFNDVSSPSLLVRYAIVAVSPCNKGLLGEGKPLDGTTGPHSSMFVEAKIDSCSRAVSLNWNAYENWAQGVQIYELWLSTNGGASQLVDTLRGTSYTYTNGQDGDLLVFHVRAREKGRNNDALSNKLSLQLNVNRPMDFLQLSAVSNNLNNNNIEVNWRWDMDTDFAGGQLQRSDDGLNWSDRINITILVAVENGFSDNNVNIDAQRYYYRIKALDACGQETISNYGSTLFLQGKVEENFTNKLFWSPLDFEQSEVYEYILYKEVGGVATRLATLFPNDSVYYDKVNTRDQDEANSCYYLVANVRVSFPADNYNRFFQSYSNKVCLHQQALLHFPNAFAPDGKNRRFRPAAAYGHTLSRYALRIFDRYGQEVFLSNNILEGWDGQFKGQEMTQGVYVYIANYTLEDGTKMEQKGTLLLLR